MPRITEARRALLLSTTRQIQTRSQLIETQRRQIELVRQLEKHPDQKRINLLKELQEARVRLGAVQAKLQAIGGSRRSYFNGATGKRASRPGSRSDRKDLRGERSFAGDGDTELQPGDVVEVAMTPAETTAVQNAR